MGSQQSSPRENAVKETSTTMEIDSPRQLTSRKRPRIDETPTDAPSTKTSDEGRKEEENDDSNTTTTRASKRRRLLSPFAKPMEKVWNKFTEHAAHWFIRLFYLNFLEMIMAKGSVDKEVQTSLVSVIGLMQDQDEDVFRRGWRALCILSHCQQRPGQLPARADPMEEDLMTVCMVMEKCVDDERIQMLGFRALRILVCGGVGRSTKDATDENWQCLYRAGVLPIVIESMRRHSGVKLLCATALTIIGMMLKQVGEAAKQDCVRYRGLPIFLQAGERWEDDTRVVQPVLFVLYQLSYRPTRQNLIDGGAISFLSSSLLSHIDNRTVIELTLGALNQISLVTNPNPFRDRQHASLRSTLLTLLVMHNETESIQFYSMVVLRSLSAVHRLPPRSTLRCVLAAMRQFPDAPGILFFGCLLMHDLIARHDNEDNVVLTLISEMGGLELVTTACHDHGEVYGLRAVAYLILTHAWEERPAEGEAATQAFGGSSDLVSQITGLDVDDLVGNAGQNVANQGNQQNDGGDDDDG